MSEQITKTYLKDIKFPFCKGCGHHHYVNNLNSALVKLDINPENIVIVSDIGCIGLIDALFESPHTFHTTHGRSTAFATGIELADSIIKDSKLKTIVVIGDGGSMIGLLHIVNSALMNVDVTVLVANNFLFGMTGGQNSSFSPLDFITATTPLGNIVPPLDICSIVEKCGAGFIARISATDKNLTDIIARAISHPGFALVEILELCTEFAVTKNKLDAKSLMKIQEQQNRPVGILKDSSERKEFGRLYKEKILDSVKENINDITISKKYSSRLTGTMKWVIAGTAGEKIQSSAYLLMRAGISSGLHCTQKNDNPVTQGSGFSLSEICISNEEIFYTGIDKPDVVIVMSNDGLKEICSNGTLSKMDKDTLFIIDETLPEVSTSARTICFPFRSVCNPNRAVMSAVLLAVNELKPVPIDAVFDVLQQQFGEKVSLYKNDLQNIINKIQNLNFNRGVTNERD